MNKLLKLMASTAAALLLSTSVLAADAKLPPDQLVYSVSTEVIDAIRKDPQLAAANPEHVNKLVDQNILPYCDFQTMTRMAVGPAWRKASQEERQEIMTAFRKLLTAVYSGAIKEASNYQVKLMKSRDSNDPRLTIVRTRLTASGSDPIQLDYRLMNENGEWKIFDVNVGGVWLVENYRSQFASVISNSGVKGLITQLNERVAKLQAEKK